MSARPIPFGESSKLAERAPVMIVNSENLNFVDNWEDFDLLLQRLERMRGPREYFNRG